MLFRKDEFDVIPKNEIRCYSTTPYISMQMLTSNHQKVIFTKGIYRTKSEMNAESSENDKIPS
jgi:hypothetical protein